MSGPEPLPPWVVIFDTPYEAFWITCNEPYVSATWRPFWDALTDKERADYLARFPPEPEWRRFLEHVALDQEVARIDAEDIATGVLQPDGSPWPTPAAVRPSLWRRLFRRC